MKVNATTIYNDGWDHTNREEIMDEYGLTYDEADAICEELKMIEIANMTDEEKNIAVLMSDRCTRSEAKHALKMGSTVYDAEEYAASFDYYNSDLDPEDEDDAKTLEAHRHMVETGDPAPDWGVTTWNGRKYYIQYVH